MNQASVIMELCMTHPLQFWRLPHMRRVGGLLAFLSLAGSFMAPGLVRAESGPVDSPRFELRGILDFGGGRSFSLHDLETGATFWIEANRSIGGYRVEDYDSSSKTLTLASKEETLQIRLRKADEVPLEVVGNATSANLEKPALKRPPRPNLSRAKSVKWSSGLKPDARKGVSDAAVNQAGSNSATPSAAGKSAAKTEASLGTLQAAEPGTKRFQGKLSYELKVRPPMRIESFGGRTRDLN